MTYIETYEGGYVDKMKSGEFDGPRTFTYTRVALIDIYITTRGFSSKICICIQKAWVLV